MQNKLTACLTGSRLAKDRAAETVSKVMIPKRWIIRRRVSFQPSAISLPFATNWVPQVRIFGPGNPRTGRCFVTGHDFSRAANSIE